MRIKNMSHLKSTSFKLLKTSKNTFLNWSTEKKYSKFEIFYVLMIEENNDVFLIIQFKIKISLIKVFLIVFIKKYMTL